MKLNKELILNKYLEKIDKITEDNDWKYAFSPEEIVNIICDVIENLDE